MKLKSIIKGILIIILVLFFIFIGLLIASHFAMQSLFESSCKEEYCESFDEEYEKQLEQNSSTLTPFPQNLTPKPIFIPKDEYSHFIHLPYVYIKDEYGVWLKYQDNMSMEYFLQKEMPKDYYLYSDKEIKLDKNPHYYSEDARHISLSENGNLIYHQSYHCVTRQDITHFDLHSNAGSSRCFPNDVYKNIKQIKELQTPIAEIDIPEKINSGFSAYAYKEPLKYGKIIGHKVIKAENNNIFEISTDEGIQKIRAYTNPSYSQKMVCAKEFCLLFVTKPDRKYCGDIYNETNVYVIRTDKKFSAISVSNAFAQSNDCWVTHFGLKDGYTADDIASFILIPTEFEYIPEKHEEKRKGEKINQHRLLVYTRDGTVINQYCDWYFPCRAAKTLPDFE